MEFVAGGLSLTQSPRLKGRKTLEDEELPTVHMSLAAFIKKTLLVALDCSSGGV